MRVWVASYPRSGNKFTRTVLTSVFGAKTFTVYDKNPAKRTAMGTEVWAGGIDAAAVPNGAFSECAFVKTHELPAPDDASPAIYVLRDGRDAYVSYAHYALNSIPENEPRPTYEDVLRTLIHSTDHFSGWSGHAEAWLNRSAPTAMLRYEDMSADPAGAVANACHVLGVRTPPPSGLMPKFEKLHAQKPKSVRKGKIGSWREEMSAELEEMFWYVHGATMSRLGYPRE